MRLNGNLVLNSDATGELQNVYIERVPSLPTFNSNEKGRIVFRTSNGIFYYNDGSAWQPFSTGGNAAALQQEVDNLEASVGPAVNADGTFNTTAFAGATHITNPTSVTDAILQLDAYANAHNTLAELDDVSFSTLSNKNVIYYDTATSKWRNAPAGSTSGVQGWAAGLDSLAGMTGPGFVAVSADGSTFTARGLVQPSEGLTITPNDGSANAVFALANDLAAYEGLTTTGIVVRDATSSAITRSIVSGLTGTVVVTNGDGISGNMSLDLQALTIPTNAGNFLKFSYDNYGRITATNAVVSSDIVGLVDSIYVNASGDTMSGDLNMGGHTVTGLAAPVAGTDAANKNYVDAAITGLTWKNAVHAKATPDESPVNISSAPATVDGHTLDVGDRILLANQTTDTEDGIWVFNGVGAALTRAVDADTYQELISATVFIAQGTTYADTGWTQTNSYLTSFAAQSWIQFSGSGTYSAGTGLSLSGNTFSVQLGAGIAALPTAEVGLDLWNSSASALILTTDGTTRSTDAASQLALLLTGSSLSQTSAGLKVAANGITEVEINSSALANNGAITGGSGTKLAVNADGVTLDISSNILEVKDSGITTAKIADGTVTNAKLQYSYITFAGTTGSSNVDLGSTLTVVGANGITTSESAGTITATLTAGLDDLSDVVITSPVAGQTLVNNGTSFVNRGTYFLYTGGTAATSHAVPHNLGQKYCNVTVVDGSDEVVIPQSIHFDDANNLTVTFTSAITCKIVVMGVYAGA